MTHTQIMPQAWMLPAIIQDAQSTPTQMLGSETTTQPDPGPTGTPTPGANQPAAPAGGSNMFFFVIIMMVALLLLMSMSGRKEKKKRAQMLSTLGKRDKIRTAGGIIGTVIEMKNDEVLIETDRASNTRLWLSRGSISAVLKSASAPDQEPTTAKDSEAIA